MSWLDGLALYDGIVTSMLVVFLWIVYYRK